jgi:hypothetical protein
MEDNWPEFIYGNKTIGEYVEVVRTENRDVKREIAALADRIRDIAKHPFPDPEDTFKHISAACRAIQALLVV